MRTSPETDRRPTEAEVAEAIGKIEHGLTSGPPPLRKEAPTKPGALFLTLGVMFPAFVVAFEAITGFCAAELFDPMPTIWHVFIAAAVPASNLLVWSAGCD